MASRPRSGKLLHTGAGTRPPCTDAGRIIGHWAESAWAHPSANAQTRRGEDGCAAVEGLTNGKGARGVGNGRCHTLLPRSLPLMSPA